MRQMNEADSLMRNIRLLIAYDGTDFSGWQCQDGRRTVQGEIEGALEKMHRERRPLAGSGRTDAGVHAAGQVANFYTFIKNMEAWRFVPALNSILPHDVRILDARETAAGFHARFDTRMRTYRYRLITGGQALPYETRYAHYLRRRPDITRLNRLAAQLRGEMDCSIFAGPTEAGKSRYRFIRSASFFAEGEKLVFEISANAFLWKMVRSIVGTLLRYEEDGLPADAFRDIVSSGDRRLAGPTAPPAGLFLWNIEYPDSV